MRTPPELVRGIEDERERLGSRRYVVALLAKEFDIDGLTDGIRLLSSCDDQRYAEAAADYLCTVRKADVVLDPDPHRRQWRIESEGEIPFLPVPKPGVFVRSVFDRTFKVRGGHYDTRYDCYRVVGPFTGSVASVELADFPGLDYELGRWFDVVGKRPVRGAG